MAPKNVDCGEILAMEKNWSWRQISWVRQTHLYHKCPKRLSTPKKIVGMQMTILIRQEIMVNHFND